MVGIYSYSNREYSHYQQVSINFKIEVCIFQHPSIKVLTTLLQKLKCYI